MQTHRFQQLWTTLEKGWNKDWDITNNWREVQLRGSLPSRAFPLFVAEKFSICCLLSFLR